MNGSNQPLHCMRLFDAEGRRLYFTEEERRAFLAAAKAPREVRTFCGTLHATGRVEKTWGYAAARGSGSWRRPSRTAART